MNKKIKSMLALVMSMMMATSFVACGGGKDNSSGTTPADSNNETSSSGGDGKVEAGTGWEDEKMYTMKDYTSQMPNTWCEFTSSDATNRDMASYFNSSFFEYNYAYDEKGNIVSGGFVVDYSAATKLEDVTSRYAGQYGLTDEMVAEGHHAFAITLRDDLTWDDGTPIKAEDFVYTMEQQLSPNYLFDTASNYYGGNYIIHNAQNYVYQGQSGWFAGDTSYTNYSTDLDSKLVFSLGNATDNENYDGASCSMRDSFGFPSSYTAANVAAYLASYGFDANALLALEHKTLAEIKADATMKATWEELIGWWQTEPDEELDFFIAEYTFPKMDFSEVGYFVGENEYELVLLIDNTLSPIGDDGNLTYEAAYYLESFPLVKKNLWEKYADKSTDVWTNSYCTSVESSASWGAYKLESYQLDKSYKVVRNEAWYGYGLEQYAGQYQTDAIETVKVDEWATAWQLFQAGEVDTVSMDASIASEYRSSARAYFTPQTYTFSLNIQSNATSRTETHNNIMLNYVEFRQAMSLAFNRDDYCAVNNPASLPNLGLLNDMYYYDVANGLIYRNTEQAKKAILTAYGAVENEDGSWTIGSKIYKDSPDDEAIDLAIDALTGYDIAYARQKMTEAYEKAKAAGDYNDGEKIVLTYGIQTENAQTERVKNWFQSALDAATEGTPLEGMIEIAYFTYSSSTWSEQFADGEYDLCFGAWGSAAFNPFYLLCETQISDDNRYALGWNPGEVDVTITLSDGKEYTYNLYEWSSNVQGKSDAKLNLTIGDWTIEDRLEVLGAVETAILQAYYSIPVYSYYSAGLRSYKYDVYSNEYNTFMGYGGIRYMTYNYDDTEWAAYVADQGGTLDYKSSN